MSDLILVRHGQAAAFTQDSDRLTELGTTQAQRLGEYWAARGLVVDQVICGTLRRHVQTEAAVRAAFEKAGRPWPAVEQDAGWNEYDAGMISTHLGSILRDTDERYRLLSEEAAAARGGPEQNRYFQRAFEVLMDTWVSGRVGAPELEPFAEFHARVLAARNRLMSGPGGRRVVAFTSGGPIGVHVQAALSGPPAQAMRVNWRVRNTSLTEFVFSSRRLSFDSFNRLPHLDQEPDLISFR